MEKTQLSSAYPQKKTLGWKTMDFNIELMTFDMEFMLNDDASMVTRHYSVNFPPTWSYCKWTILGLGVTKFHLPTSEFLNSAVSLVISWSVLFNTAWQWHPLLQAKRQKNASDFWKTTTRGSAPQFGGIPPPGCWSRVSNPTGDVTLSCATARRARTGTTALRLLGCQGMARMRAEKVGLKRKHV